MSAPPELAALDDALGEVDALYLDERDATDLGRLRVAVIRRRLGVDDDLSEDDVRRAWELVSIFRERLAEDVCTIGPTLTADEVQRVFVEDPEKHTPNDMRLVLVANELAHRRVGHYGFKPKNVPRILFPVAVARPPRLARRGNAARRSRRRTSRSRARSPGRSTDDDPPSRTLLDLRPELRS